MVAPGQCTSTVLVMVLLIASFTSFLTGGFVIPTLCPPMVRRSIPRGGEETMVVVKRSRMNDKQHVSGDFGGRRGGSVVNTGAIAEQDGRGRRPPLEANFYEENLLDKFALNFFRGLLQEEIKYASPLEGYDGLIDEAQNYYVIQGASPEETQSMVNRLLTAMSGPILPPLYRLFIAPGPWAPLSTALVTPYLLKFLVGPNAVALRCDGKLGGVHIQGADSLRQPVARDYAQICFFQETLGLNMTMSPNFDTYECSLSFGLDPALVESDPPGCLRGCSCKKLEEQIMPTCIKSQHSPRTLH